MGLGLGFWFILFWGTLNLRTYKKIPPINCRLYVEEHPGRSVPLCVSADTPGIEDPAFTVGSVSQNVGFTIACGPSPYGVQTKGFRVQKPKAPT